jgi:hypothetical protein
VIHGHGDILACLLIALWAGKKPTQRTNEMINFGLLGWADDKERPHHGTTLKVRDK